MDNLSQDAAAAREAGLSYGKWKALQPEKLPAERYPLRGQEKRMYCAFCGNIIPPDSKRRKYCGEECEYAASLERKRQLRLQQSVTV